MGGWTLHDIETLDVAAYRVLVEWINESTADAGEGSIDMDAVVAARHAKDRQHG